MFRFRRQPVALDARSRTPKVPQSANTVGRKSFGVYELRLG
jgi:hypothetical protein